MSLYSQPLLQDPAAVRFLSCEPLLGPVNLDEFLFADCDNCDGSGEALHGQNCSRCKGSGKDCYTPIDELHWVIVGGESGPKARPMALGWAKDIVRECKAAGVAVHVKQLGDNPTNREGEPCPHIRSRAGREMSEWPEEFRVREWPR